MSDVIVKSNDQCDLYLKKTTIVILLNKLFLCEFACNQLKCSILQLKKEISLNASNEIALNWIISILSMESSSSLQIRKFFEEKSQNPNYKSYFIEKSLIDEKISLKKNSSSAAQYLQDKSTHIRIAETILSRRLQSEEIKSLDQLLEMLQGNISQFIEMLYDSQEYKSKVKNKCSAMPHLSNAEFIIYLFNGILGRFPTVYELYAWAYHHLNENYSREEVYAALQKSVDPLLLQNNLVLETFGRKKILNPAINDSKLNHSGATVMGTNQLVSVEDWNEIKFNLSDTKNNHFAKISQNCIFYKQYNSEPRNTPILSIITSLYNGDKFIRNFMANIVNQLNFHAFELIIIDACSPGDEYTVIKEYTSKFSNIVYHRCEDRISIYDAWNLGVSMSKGKYLTNANLDDLRAPYGLSMQVECLEHFPSFDVCYGDFYYYFEPNPSWDLVESIGIKSSLTHVSPGVLMSCNYPHCAPLWRKSLHEDVGLFDTKYASAADWEFWLRCIKAQKNFYFIPIPLSGYYQNPEGISTSSETKGIEEVASITNRHFKDLIMNDDSALMVTDSRFNHQHLASQSLPRRSQLLLSYIESQSRHRNLNTSTSFVSVQ